MSAVSKHIINYSWLFYTEANSDVTLSDRQGEMWFIQSGILFSLKKKALASIYWHLQATALPRPLETGKLNNKELVFLNEHQKSLEGGILKGKGEQGNMTAQIINVIFEITL
jgi:hypothetical protein